ncbi:MAG: GrpB family protein [Bacteroidota bacterium]
MYIHIAPYNPLWPQTFEQEAAFIQQIVGSNLNYIHHIGSTSVPGLMAKPIIDILLDVKELRFLDTQNREFEALGYEVMGEYGIEGRRYFRKGGDKRTHHIHAFQSGSNHLDRHLAFRDYLIAHPEVAQAYGELKVKVAERSKQDIEAYGDGKDAFVKEYERKALDWIQHKKTSSHEK